MISKLASILFLGLAALVFFVSVTTLIGHAAAIAIPWEQAKSFLQTRPVLFLFITDLVLIAAPTFLYGLLYGAVCSHIVKRRSWWIGLTISTPCIVFMAHDRLSIPAEYLSQTMILNGILMFLVFAVGPTLGSTWLGFRDRQFTWVTRD